MVRWAEATEPAVDDEPVHSDDEPRRRSKRVTFFLALLAIVFVGYGVVRVVSLEASAFLIGAMALTPYVAAAALIAALVTIIAGRKILALIVLIVALSLGALLGPRYLSEEQPQNRGPHLRVMAANLHVGLGDARRVISLVRSEQVDILALPELTPYAVSDLDSAGLRELLPYRVFDERPGGGGSGIASKMPLRKVILMDDTSLAQPSAIVDLPGRQDIELTAVHVQPPLSTSDAEAWQRELKALPRPAERRVSILAGDFNATLDHVAFRDLVDRGYADAAEESGDGLIPTWATWPSGPPLTLDHIVVDAGCAVSSYSVHDLPGSDHDAIIAEVVLP